MGGSLLCTPLTEARGTSTSSKGAPCRLSLEAQAGSTTPLCVTNLCGRVCCRSTVQCAAGSAAWRWFWPPRRAQTRPGSSMPQGRDCHLTQLYSHLSLHVVCQLLSKLAHAGCHGGMWCQPLSGVCTGMLSHADKWASGQGLAPSVAVDLSAQHGRLDVPQRA